MDQAEHLAIKAFLSWVVLIWLRAYSCPLCLQFIERLRYSGSGLCRQC